MKIFKMAAIRAKTLFDKRLFIVAALVPIIGSRFLKLEEKNIFIGIACDQSFKANLDPFLQTEYFASEAELKSAVLSYKIDCGFFVSESSDYKKSIKLYKTPSTTSDSYAAAIVASVAIGDRPLGEAVLEKYLPPEKLEKLEIDYGRYAPSMQIEYADRNGAPVKQNSLPRLLYFLAVGASAFVITFAAFLETASEKRDAIADRIKTLRAGFAYYAASALCVILFNAAYIFVSVIIATPGKAGL
jgi:hypothetical protein